MNTIQGVHTSEIWVSATRPNYLISPQYPDVRFSCLECGSLDVFITNGNEKSIMKCLDCDNMEKIT
jgi:transcription elongation factor Elf1